MTQEGEMTNRRNSFKLDESLLRVLNKSQSVIEIKYFENLEDQVHDIAIQNYQLEIIADLFLECLKGLAFTGLRRYFNFKQIFSRKLA